MTAIILTTYDRIDDFLVNLEILKDKVVIPIYMKKEVPDYFLKELENGIYCDGICFALGPMLALCTGLRKAQELGADWIVYRNGDDWLFNNDFFQETENILKNSNYVAAGYNWLSVNSYREFAFNELWLKVAAFYPSVASFEKYCLSSNRKRLCETKVAQWMEMVTGQDWCKFYRLPGRELVPGIGTETEHLTLIADLLKIKLSEDVIKQREVNNRYFNEAWQLIGSHDNNQRFFYYSKIRNKIKNFIDLEKGKHFARWLESIHLKQVWNLPTVEIRRFAEYNKGYDLTKKAIKLPRVILGKKFVRKLL